MKKIIKGFNAKMNTLNDQPFISEKVNYAEEYKKFLAGGGELGMFNPKEGILPRTCATCFYRGKLLKEVDFPSGRGDCHCGAKSEIAKQDFGYKPKDVMPEKIDGKEVGNYCKHWLDFMAE